jgi:hypothetical protein
MEEKTGLTTDELMDWSLYEFNERLYYYAVKADTERRHFEIIQRPKPGKHK